MSRMFVLFLQYNKTELIYLATGRSSYQSREQGKVEEQTRTFQFSFKQERLAHLCHKPARYMNLRSNFFIDLEINIVTDKADGWLVCLG